MEKSYVSMKKFPGLENTDVSMLLLFNQKNRASYHSLILGL